MPVLTAAEPAPAGGAALDQIIIATSGATVATLVLAWLVLGHRSGRHTLLDRGGALASKASGLPGWAALPSAVATISLLTALFGMMWDISLHVDNGRDEGPLANPSHYFILVGLFGIFSAGIPAIAMPKKGQQPGPAALKIAPGWHAPVGGVLMAVCGAFALIGFPLDDVWHRIFGQDVTLWGPTHLMLIGGAGMTLIGIAVLLAEAYRSGDKPADDLSPKAHARLSYVRRSAQMGGLLAGLATFQAEWDFGVPQYAMVFHPFLIALGAGFALVAARVWIGPGGALGAAVMFFVTRGIVSLLVSATGETMPAQPLYFGEALLVEAIALAFVARRPVVFGAVAGAAIGSIGFASEWAWTQVAFRVPWEAPLLPEGLGYAIVGGIGGGVLGSLLALGLMGRLPKPSIARPVFGLSFLALMVAVGLGLTTPEPPPVTASVTTEDVTGKDGREVMATIRFSDPDTGEDATFINGTAWQGDGFRASPLEEVSPGVWRTTEPLPAYGSWKSLIRVHEDGALAAVPVFLPEDPAIENAKEVPALAQFTRPLGEERQILQRELKDDVPGWLWGTASAVVLSIYLLFFGALAWGVARLSRATESTSEPRDRPTGARTSRPSVVPVPQG